MPGIYFQSEVRIWAAACIPVQHRRPLLPLRGGATRDVATDHRQTPIQSVNQSWVRSAVEPLTSMPLLKETTNGAASPRRMRSAGPDVYTAALHVFHTIVRGSGTLLHANIVVGHVAIHRRPLQPRHAASGGCLISPSKQDRQRFRPGCQSGLAQCAPLVLARQAHLYAKPAIVQRD